MPNEFARPRLIEFIDLKMPPERRMAWRYYRKIPSARLINIVCHESRAARLANTKTGMGQ
jgi:hypothetical protein